MSETSIPALNPYVDPDALRRDVSIDIADLSGGMQQQAGLYVHYAAQAVRAKRQYERQKSTLEILEAKLDRHYRKTLVNEETDAKGKTVTKKATEPQIRAAIVEDSRWVALNARMLDAQQIWKLAEVAERAFDHRKDMLLQMARDAARESAGSLRVVANQGNRDRLMDAMKGVDGATKPVSAD